MPETFWLSLLVIQLLMTDNASVLVRLRDKKNSLAAPHFSCLLSYRSGIPSVIPAHSSIPGRAGLSPFLSSFLLTPRAAGQQLQSDYFGFFGSRPGKKAAG